LGGCKERPKNSAYGKELARKTEILKTFIDKPRAVIVPPDSLFLEFLPDSVFLSTRSNLVYVVNSSCSFCIGKFVEFIYLIGDNVSMSVYLLTNDEATDRVEYHLSEAKINSMNVHIIGAKYTPEVWLKNNSLVYVVRNGIVTNKFFYESI
jgi:hypothetical protein